MSSVPTVAFAFMAPDALRVFLQIAGYRVSVFTGEPDSLDFRQDKPSANIVLLPNFAKRNLLRHHVDQIGRLVVMTNGKHEDLIDLDIPLLDATVTGDVLRQLRDKTPHFYTKKIQDAAVSLELEPAPVAAAPVAQEPPPADPGVLDQWFDKLDGGLPEVDFAQLVEYPVCQYMTGQLGRKSLQGAMKVLAKQSIDKTVVKAFYRWLIKYAGKMSPAMKQYLMPSTEADALTVQEAAKKFKVAAVDIELLENIYLELQKPTVDTTTTGDVEDER